MIIGETIFTLLVYLILVPAFMKLVSPAGDFWIVFAFGVVGSTFIFVKPGLPRLGGISDVMRSRDYSAILLLGGLFSKTFLRFDWPIRSVRLDFAPLDRFWASLSTAVRQ